MLIYRFSYHFVCFNSRISYPLIYLKPEKVPLSGGASPYRTLKGVPPPPQVNFYFVSSAEEAQKLIDDFETQHTVKFSYYMASKGFGGTGEK